MLALLRETIASMTAFAPYFSVPVWQQAQVLMVGAVLAPSRRTVASAGTGSETQESHRLGGANDPSGTALVAGTTPGFRGRRRLCRAVPTGRDSGAVSIYRQR